MSSQVYNQNYNSAAPGYNGPAPIDNSYHSSYPQQQQQWGQQQYQQPSVLTEQQWGQQKYQQPQQWEQQQYQQPPQQQYGQPPQQQQQHQQHQQQQQQWGQQQYQQPMQQASGFNFNNLCSLPFVSIKQKVEQAEAITGFETGNKYLVLDPSNNLIMKCSEKSSLFAKVALGAGRSMDIKITDASGATIMNITRPFKLWHKDVTIVDGSGRTIGSVLKKFAIGKTIFHVMDGADTQLFTIRGGAFINVGKSRKFTITNSQGTEVGYIQKEWNGLLKEAFTDADNFTLNFPAGTSGETRALLIATTLFIDLSHFEK